MPTPLLREYFARRLRDAQPEAWRAVHRRLIEKHGYGRRQQELEDAEKALLSC